MIVVTGATGNLGSQIVDRLLDRLPPDAVGVSVRDVDRAAGLAERGARVRAGDFTDPATLTHAFEGADKVLIVSAAIRGPGALVANRAAIDAARAAGAKRILYTSHQAASRDSLFAAQPTHAATEEHLAGLGFPSPPCATGSTRARSASPSARRWRPGNSWRRRTARCPGPRTPTWPRPPPSR